MITKSVYARMSRPLANEPLVRGSMKTMYVEWLIQLTQIMNAYWIIYTSRNDASNQSSILNTANHN